MMPVIQHLSFDLWLTLIASNPAFKPARARLIHQHFGPPASEAEVLAVVAEFDRLVNTMNEQTGRNIDCYEIVYFILHRLGLDIKLIPIAQMDAFYTAMEQLFIAYPPRLLDEDTWNTLAQLKSKGYSLNISSNTGFIRGRTMRHWLESIGQSKLFDFMVFSDEINQSKPSALFFGQVFDQAQALGVQNPAAILHIGDNPLADDDGAQAFGFSAYLFDARSTKLTTFLQTLP